ncbi:MAG: DUF3341 domain-containing protein [Caldilineaceae bacterium]
MPIPDTVQPITLYGLMAEFIDEEALVVAARQTKAAGYQVVEAYTPFPIEGLAEVLGVRGRRLPLIVLAGGILGGGGALFMQWYAATISYPINVAGRPLASWPSFVPVSFELTILAAAFAAVLGMFALNHLPQPYHPVFNAERFLRASNDRFFLSVEATDPQFDRVETEQFLANLAGVEAVFEINEEL